MKTLAVRLALALSFVLFGAADPGVYPAPVAVVYPLTVTGQTGPDAGANVATLLATKLSQLGGISVKPYPPGTQRSDYLSAAIAAGADYYVTGYMTPVGPEISMIVQVVSTDSGSIVYSTTTMVRTYGDALAQADVLRAAMLHHAGRSLAALDAPAPAPSSSAPPNAKNGVNLSQALKRRRRTSPSPSPSASVAATQATATATEPATAVPAATPVPVALAGPAARRGLIAAFDGPADPTARTYAARAFASALARYGQNAGVVPVAGPDALAHAPDLCRANADAGLLYVGSLATAGDASAGNVTLDIAAYDCSGKALARRQASSATRGRGGVSAAIDRAAGAAAAGFRKGPPLPVSRPASS